MSYAYYPGCSLEATAKEYDISFRSVFTALGVDYQEIEDWSCCGASAAHATSRLLSVALPARDLGKAEAMGRDVVAPCPACYQNLKHAREFVLESEENREKLRRALEGTGVKVEGSVKVKHVLEVLLKDIGIEKIAEKVAEPLEGLRVVPYYGCYIVRPPGRESFDDVENPTSMDRIIQALGATVLPFTRKTRCCGAPVMMSQEEEMHRLSYEIIKEAREAGAQAIVVACPMCHFSLDAKQPEIESHMGEQLGVPVLYITQLIGLALGLDPYAELGMDKNMVAPDEIIRKYSKKAVKAKA
ncbi:MAG: heterodisulfide reductase subunit B [Euryarchaeota archaeon]|nr:heterodisulfide reductase subunit B [Euryarchaeota archaeon]